MGAASMGVAIAAHHEDANPMAPAAAGSKAWDGEYMGVSVAELRRNKA